MKWFWLFLLLPLLMLSLRPHEAKAQAPEECLTPEQAEEFFAHFKVSHWNPDQKELIPITSVPDLCDDTSLIHRLATAVRFMNELNAYQDPNSSSIVSREGAGNYFKNRIVHIQIEPKDALLCPPGVIAYVYRMEKDVMHICSAGLANFTSPLMMSYILIHEARHTDGFSHVPCAHGLHRKSDGDDPDSSGSCDNSYEYQGSYGVAAGFMGDIAKFAPDPLMRQQARSTFVVDLVQRFNELPLDIKPGLLAQTIEGEISFFDGRQKTTLFTLPNPETLLTLRGDLPTFFDPQGQAKTFVFSPEMIDTPGDYAKDYKTAYTPLERQNLRDVYYGSLHDYSCLLFDNFLRCGDNFANDSDIELPLSSLRPLHFLVTENSALVKKEELYIVAEDGFLYALPGTWEELKAWVQEPHWTPSSQKYHLMNLVSIAPNHPMEYAVDFTGRLMRFTPRTRSWSQVKSYQENILQKIVGPFYWSQTLEDL